VNASLTLARNKLLQVADEKAAKISRFANTVVGVVCRGTHGIFFQLGDGAGVAFNERLELTALNFGYSKEYANETFFLSDANWEQYLKFVPIFRVSTNIVLMTDGVTPFAFDGNIPQTEFFDPLISFLRQHPIDIGASAVSRLLNEDDARSQVSDDKTLFWAGLSPRRIE
jgi:hypothetical protein